MSRKRKRGRKHRALKDKRPATLDALERKANADLAAHHHRDAISAYKDLLKRERRPQWIEGLAAAYRGRAADLAGKGMIKEAIAIWQNRASACDGACVSLWYDRNEILSAASGRLKVDETYIGGRLRVPTRTCHLVSDCSPVEDMGAVSSRAACVSRSFRTASKKRWNRLSGPTCNRERRHEPTDGPATITCTIWAIGM